MQLDFKTNVTLSEGSADAKICFISSVPSWEGKPLSELSKSFVLDTAKRAGISAQDISFEVLLDFVPPGRKWHTVSFDQKQAATKCLHDRLKYRTSATTYIPLDSGTLEALTRYSSIDDWQLSIISATKLSGQKVIPLLHPERVFSDFKNSPMFTFGMMRIKEEMNDPKIKTKLRVFHIGPTFEKAISFMAANCLFADELSVDIETAHGQITCVGFAPTETEAICIPTLPSDWPPEQFFKLWEWIRDVMEGPSKKVFQNFIYDTTYFSKYGIRTKNLWHDTMLANKFLHPELPMGLDTIARIYTKEPYWKDEGKDWRAVSDHNQFWTYNCKDTTVTLEAAHAQRIDLHSRNLSTAFNTLVMSLSPAAAEMCWRGLPVDAGRRANLIATTEAELVRENALLSGLAEAATGKPLNSRSPKQVKEFFKAKKYKIPIKKGKETTDATALMKLQQRYPRDESIKLLLSLSEKNKSMSSYLKPRPYSDGRFRFSLNLHGTEPGRWSCRKDPWDNGINAQTISSGLKKMFVAPPGWLFLEADLKQADARFVAWDAPEPTLIKFFNENKDIHRFVASRPELFNKPESEVTKDERQLGKKVGHASNYGMRGIRLSEICLLEMGIYLSPERAEQMLEGYHRVFPGIRMWQQRIASEIRRTKRLTTPLGRERYFYDRIGDDLYRTAYAYRPPSTVSDVINCLIRHVYINRNPEKLHMVLQAHDAGIFLVEESYLSEALELIKDENTWNPKISLAGGILQIPTEIKAGSCWGEAQHLYG